MADEYISREALKTACINALSFIAENAKGEEEHVLNCEKTAYWDFDLHCFIERITAEGKDILSNIRARRNAESSGVRILTDFIKELPAADAVPIIHAHWIEREYKYSDPDYDPLFRRRFYCSACGDWQSYGKTTYCPYCGARMDEESYIENEQTEERQ